MTVVSTKEFNINQEKYLDLALNEQVLIQRNDCMFIVTKASEPKLKHKKPDDELRRAVTMDEVKGRLHSHIHNLFANK